MSSDAPSTTVPAPESAASEPLLVFVHIRKTAGKTLRQILYRQYGRGGTRLVRNYFVAPETSLNVVKGLAAEPPPELGVVHGHILFWPDIEWPEGTQFLTLLRDPVERAISHYFWLRARNRRFSKSLEQAITEGSIHDNLQTRVLAASMPPFGETTDEMLEDALRSLERLTVIGLTERFDESLVLATRRLGWRRMLYRRENVTPDRKPREAIQPRVIDLVKRYNALDIELYERASKQFEREVEDQGEGFAIEVAALQRANERAASVAEDAPLDPLPSTIGGPNGGATGDLDLRELLIEAQAELLQRDAAIEYLTSVSTPRGAARAASRPHKSATPAARRKAALEAAIERARIRLDTTRKEIRALEKEGASQSQAAKLAALRQAEITVQKRLEGFERRSAKIQTAAKAAEADDGIEAASAAGEEAPRPKKKQAAAPAADGRRKKSLAAAPAAEVEKPRPGPEPKGPERRRATSLEGTRRFARAAPEVVWEILDRPDRIASLIPAVESFDVDDETHWTAKVKIPLRPGTPLLLRCEKSDQRPPEHGRLTVQGKGAGAAVKIDGTFDLSEREGGTDMKWRTDVLLTGPVGPMGSRVLQVLVRKQMKSLLAALEREVKQGRRARPVAADESQDES
jgi:carbon monoxide dehydrogenase subunit G